MTDIVFEYIDDQGRTVRCNRLLFARRALNDALQFGDYKRLNIAIDYELLTELRQFPDEFKRAVGLQQNPKKKGRKFAQNDKQKHDRNHEIWKRLHYWHGYGKPDNADKPLPIRSSGNAGDACGKVAIEFSITVDAVYQVYKALKNEQYITEGAGKVAAWLSEKKGKQDRQKDKERLLK